MDGWWNEIDRDVRSCLERFGPMSPRTWPPAAAVRGGRVLRALDAGAGGKAPHLARRAAARRRRPSALAVTRRIAAGSRRPQRPALTPPDTRVSFWRLDVRRCGLVVQPG